MGTDRGRETETKEKCVKMIWGWFVRGKNKID